MDKLKAGSRRGAERVKNPSHYRLDLIKENTFNRLWSVRMTRMRLWIGAGAFIAAVAALIFVIFAYTPVGRILPMKMEKSTRAAYLEMALRLDSLEQTLADSRQYASSVSAIIEGRSLVDKTSEVEPAAIDSAALQARENERNFVRDYESSQRYTLSVLAPIAAEGMDFAYPVDGFVSEAVENPDSKVLTLRGGRSTPASAVYKGNVVSIVVGSDGTTTVALQHPNDFISIYGGLKDVVVSRGQIVSRNQRLGHSETALRFELWHKGTPLPPSEYLGL